MCVPWFGRGKDGTVVTAPICPSGTQVETWTQRHKKAEFVFDFSCSEGFSRACNKLLEISQKVA